MRGIDERIPHRKREHDHSDSPEGIEIDRYQRGNSAVAELPLGVRLGRCRHADGDRRGGVVGQWRSGAISFYQNRPDRFTRAAKTKMAAAMAAISMRATASEPYAGSAASCPRSAFAAAMIFVCWCDGTSS